MKGIARTLPIMAAAILLAGCFSQTPDQETSLEHAKRISSQYDNYYFFESTNFEFDNAWEEDGRYHARIHYDLVPRLAYVDALQEVFNDGVSELQEENMTADLVAMQMKLYVEMNEITEAQEQYLQGWRSDSEFIDHMITEEDEERFASHLFLISSQVLFDDFGLSVNQGPDDPYEREIIISYRDTENGWEFADSYRDNR